MITAMCDVVLATGLASRPSSAEDAAAAAQPPDSLMNQRARDSTAPGQSRSARPRAAAWLRALDDRVLGPPRVELRSARTCLLVASTAWLIVLGLVILGGATGAHAWITASGGLLGTAIVSTIQWRLAVRRDQHR